MKMLLRVELPHEPFYLNFQEDLQMAGFDDLGKK